MTNRPVLAVVAASVVVQVVIAVMLWLALDRLDRVEHAAANTCYAVTALRAAEPTAGFLGAAPDPFANVDQCAP